MNTSTFPNNTRRSCSFSLLDNKVLTYVISSACLALLSPKDPQLTDSFLPPLPRRRAIIAMRECGPQGVDHLNPLPLSVPVRIIGSIVVRPASCLEDRLAPHWLNN